MEWTTSLDEVPDVIFMLDGADRIVRCNCAWDAFAMANGGLSLTGGRQVGVDVFNVVPEDLRPFYRNGFGLVREHGREWSHVYDCSSPSVFRRFHMRVLPAGREKLLVVNSLVVERPFDHNAPEHTIGRYMEASGIVTMCSHCRRTANLSENTWEWVPAFVARMPDFVSHGLCDFCRSYHYPEFPPRSVKTRRLPV